MRLSDTVGENMKPLGFLSAGLGVLILSSTATMAQTTGRQCVPAVANPSAYGSCYIASVGGADVCRCLIRPNTLINRPESGGGGPASPPSVGPPSGGGPPDNGGPPDDGGGPPDQAGNCPPSAGGTTVASNGGGKSSGGGGASAGGSSKK
jgi:hypothetical protein